MNQHFGKQALPVARELPDVRQAYAAFSALSAVARRYFAGALGGKLLLYGELTASGASAAIAGNVAGAATLGVDADEARLKEGIRNGICDFFVNSLDEALRILKNEIRKAAPVSVGLEGEIASVLAEIAERGVQPDLIGEMPASSEVIRQLMDRGAILFNPAALAGKTESAPTNRIPVAWSAEKAPAVWLPKADLLASQVLESADDERHRWLRLAPRYLRKQTSCERYLEMTPDEVGNFESLLDMQVRDGILGTRITLRKL